MRRRSSCKAICWGCGMFEFELVPLASVALAIKDGTHGTHVRYENGVPLLSAKNISDSGTIEWDENDDRISEAEYKQIHRTFQLQDKDLLLTIVGSIGRRAIYHGEFVTFQRSVAYVRPNFNKVSERFLFHWFGHYDFYRDLCRRSNATAQAGLYLGELAKSSIPSCNLKEQGQIATVLDTLDTTIRQTETIIAKLQQMKQGLLHDLLTRGIDANGELRPPVEEAPQLYKKSPLGWIPKEWDAPKLFERLAVMGGKRLPAGHSYSDIPTSFKYLRVTDFFQRRYVIDELENLHESTFLALSRYEIEPGQLYISIAGSLGFVGAHEVHSGAEIRTILTENAARLVPLESVNSYFVAAYMNTSMMQKQIEYEKGTGGGVPKLALFRIEQLHIAIPKRHEQDLIVQRSVAIENRLKEEMAYLSKLNKQKFGLMDDLLTGRVRVTPLLNQ